LKRLGFTIAEFVVSISIMLIIVSATVPIVFKKQKITTHIARKSGELICSCADTSTNACVFELETTGRNEFISVQMIGGGGAGGPIQGGGAGEAKITTFPTLGGTFMAVLGEGGDPNAEKNGGNTLFMQKNDDGTWKLIEFAKGGHYTSHSNYDEAILASDDADNLKFALNKGKKANFNNATGFPCGSGGDGAYNGATAQKGMSGEVIIKW